MTWTQAVAGWLAPRNLTSRVNTNSELNAFGLTPALGGLLLVAIAAVAILRANDFKCAKRIVLRFNPDGMGFVEPMLKDGECSA